MTLWRLDLGGPTLQPVRLLAPTTDGSLNDSIACRASHPELAYVPGALYVTWEETCDGGSHWQQFLRRLE